MKHAVIVRFKVVVSFWHEILIKHILLCCIFVSIQSNEYDLSPLPHSSVICMSYFLQSFQTPDIICDERGELQHTVCD